MIQELTERRPMGREQFLALLRELLEQIRMEQEARLAQLNQQQESVQGRVRRSFWGD